MIIHDRAFPHPVLAPFRDDVTPSQFELIVSATSDADNFYLDIKFEYANPTLTDLIARGRAVHAVHVECRRNFYREMFPLKTTAGRLTISTGELVGRVEVCGFIRALEGIDQYRIDGSHADYGDHGFLIRTGDILAAATTRTFDAYVDYDPLRRISSILTIRRADAIQDGPMEVATDDDRIVATLSQNDYDRYTDLKGDPSLAPLLANQVVVPALLHALHEMRGSSDEDFELDLRKRWFRSVHRKLEESGIDIRGANVQLIEAVQALLRLPLRRTLDALIRMSSEDEE